MTRLADKELYELEKQWYRMQNDPYFPSDPKQLALIEEVKQRRAAEAIHPHHEESD